MNTAHRAVDHLAATASAGTGTTHQLVCFLRAIANMVDADRDFFQRRCHGRSRFRLHVRAMRYLVRSTRHRFGRFVNLAGAVHDLAQAATQAIDQLVKRHQHLGDFVFTLHLGAAGKVQVAGNVLHQLSCATQAAVYLAVNSKTDQANQQCPQRGQADGNTQRLGLNGSGAHTVCFYIGVVVLGVLVQRRYRVVNGWQITLVQLAGFFGTLLARQVEDIAVEAPHPLQLLALVVQQALVFRVGHQGFVRFERRLGQAALLFHLGFDTLHAGGVGINDVQQHQPVVIQKIGPRIGQQLDAGNRGFRVVQQCLKALELPDGPAAQHQHTQHGNQYQQAEFMRNFHNFPLCRLL